MNKSRCRVSMAALAAAIVAVLGAFAGVMGGTPQTIVVNGVNDFLAANRIENTDSLDTQYAPIDLGGVYVTNDANKLYIGFSYSKDGWGTCQVGIHMATGTPSGGTTDSWGRKIAWNTAPRKPDYQAYCNMDNAWQELRHWNGSSWALLYSGSNSLGWVITTGFEEVGFNLSDLGLAAGDTVRIEIVTTQDGSTKGPLDCMVNDGNQLSRPSGTTWDVATAVELDSMYTYVVMTAGDAVPPTVTYATGSHSSGSDVTVQAIDVVYSEPVDKTTAETKTNYALSGTVVAIDSVRRDATLLNKVKVYLHSTIAQQASFYGVTVTNVKDLANNTIVASGTTNVGCFFLQKVYFIGHMSYHLLTHTVPPIDTFTVEGDLAPLTFIGCDKGIMTTTGGGTYEKPVIFSLIGQGCGGTPSADSTLQWKFMHQCTEYEPLGTNRYSVLSSVNGPLDTLDYWWGNWDPNDYTAHAIDVIFKVDLSAFSPTVDSVVAINGSELPLNFNVPSITNMADNGVYPDATAGDKIYSKKVRFPSSTFKNMGYKFLYNNRYECTLQGNRGLYLNDAAYDTVGGTLGPLVMPLAYYDRCGTIGHAVKVIFRVATLGMGAPDTIAVNGEPNNQLPHVISWVIPSINRMRDDGVSPDATAGDGIYTVAVTFPDSSGKYVEYKYLHNRTYECATTGNRVIYLDDAYNASSNPQIIDLAYFNSCVTTDVPTETPVVPLALHQNYPNPFNPATVISFVAPSMGRAVLKVYDVKGALVRTLLDDFVAVGEVRVRWDGKDESGRGVSSGVYFYELRIGNERVSRKMVLLR
jgi:hypothetical protein